MIFVEFGFVRLHDCEMTNNSELPEEIDCSMYLLNLVFDAKYNLCKSKVLLVGCSHTILSLQSISRDVADNVSHPRRLDPTM